MRPQLQTQIQEQACIRLLINAAELLFCLVHVSGSLVIKIKPQKAAAEASVQFNFSVEMCQLIRPAMK